MDIGKLALIKQLNQFPYYTKQNLSLILKKDRFSLDYWIKKLIGDQILIPLKKGVYSSVFYINNIKEKGFFELYLQKLAGILRQPSYISLETALSYYGMIPEESFNITSITLKSTRVYKNQLATFIYRNIKKDLFLGFSEKSETYPISRATKAKALFDWLYLKKFANIEEIKTFLLDKGRINWSVFKKKDKMEFNDYVKISSSKKMILISKIIDSQIKYGQSI